MADIMRIAVTALMTARIMTAVEPFDFRQTKWGFTRDQVIAAEGMPIKEMPDVLLFRTTVAEHKALIEYEFAAGKLWRSVYILAERYADPSGYLTTAAKWKQSLTEKYGKPRTQMDWKNRLFAGDTEKLGLAVSAGHVRIEEHWQTEATKIRLIIAGGDHTTSVMIAYASKALEALAASEQKAKDKSVF